MRRCPVEGRGCEAKVEVRKEVSRCNVTVEVKREVRRYDTGMEIKKQGRRCITGMEIKRGAKGQYECLMEEEEARKRHVGPYQYQTPGEIEHRMNWRKSGLPGW